MENRKVFIYLNRRNVQLNKRKNQAKAFWIRYKADEREGKNSRPGNFYAEVKKLGFEPSLIFDVGAYHGDFSQLCFDIWPATKITAFEALENKIYNLRSLFKNSQFRVH